MLNHTSKLNSLTPLQLKQQLPTGGENYGFTYQLWHMCCIWKYLHVNERNFSELFLNILYFGMLFASFYYHLAQDYGNLSNT